MMKYIKALYRSTHGIRQAISASIIALSFLLIALSAAFFVAYFFFHGYGWLVVLFFAAILASCMVDEIKN